jgi:hypothetical protein
MAERTLCEAVGTSAGLHADKLQLDALDGRLAFRNGKRAYRRQDGHMSKAIQDRSIVPPNGLERLQFAVFRCPSITNLGILPVATWTIPLIKRHEARHNIIPFWHSRGSRESA